VLQVMLPHYLIELSLSNILPDLVHRVDYIVLGNCAAAISVELVKYCLKHPFIKKLFYI
jgi:hypothetical protein